MSGEIWYVYWCIMVDNGMANSGDILGLIVVFYLYGSGEERYANGE